MTDVVLLECEGRTVGVTHSDLNCNLLPLLALRHLYNTTPFLDSVVQLEEIQDVTADLRHGADGLAPLLHQLKETIQECPSLRVRAQLVQLVQLFRQV